MTNSPARLTLGQPDDWHLHLRDGPALAAVRGADRARVPACNRHAKPEAAGHHDGGRGGLPDAHPGGAAGRGVFRAADDALPDRQHPGGRKSPPPRPPDSCTRSSTTRRAPRPTPTRASRRSTACSARWRRWRSTASSCACTAKSPTPTSTCSTASVCSSIRCSQRIVRDFPGLKVVLEHITTREAAAFVRECSVQHRRHDHAAAPPVVAQRALRRRLAPALLLPADPEARNAPAGAGGRRDIGQPAVLPRHGLGSACAAYEGECLRLRRLLQRTGGPRAVRRGVRGRGRARPARRIRAWLRRRLLRPAVAIPAG